MSSSDGETKSTFQPSHSSLEWPVLSYFLTVYLADIFINNSEIVCHKDASCCSLLDYEMPSPSLSKNVRKRDMGMQGRALQGWQVQRTSKQVQGKVWLCKQVEEGAKHGLTL